MAKNDFYEPIDLHKRELLNARLQALITLPANPFEGQICYHSISSKKLGALYNGTEWRYFGLPPLGNSYDSQALMLADQVNQLPDYAYFDGLKEWRKLETSTGVIGDYREMGGDSTYELIESQATVIKFDSFSGYVHGNTAVITGAMTYDFTGAIRGVVVIVKHRASSFTIPAKSVVIAGYYSPNVDNYIFFELIKKNIGTEVILVTINQDV